ncbi:MAG: phosphate/phosphite/phosphonate ABC transporter substrate-binding protein [Chloroflexota bacterium]
MAEPSGLRVLSYLAPSLPERLFLLLAEHLQRQLGLPVTTRFDSATSGPPVGGPNPLRRGEADLAFMCAPSYLRLRSELPPSVDLVPAAPLFDDPRNAGRPVYFTHVVVRQDNPARRFQDLRSGCWAYNDEVSLSGWYCLLLELASLGESRDFFASLVQSGSHLASLRLVAQGEASAAAVDSNTWLWLRQQRPESLAGLRVLTSWGPYPVQPAVFRADLSSALKRAIAQALLCLPVSEAQRQELAGVGLLGFAPVAEQDYLAYAAALTAPGALQPPGVVADESGRLIPY